MKYHKIIAGTFDNRPNRFIAYVDIMGKMERVHVKNTGRCKELLIPGAEVYLEESENRERSTRYDLVAVRKNDRLINMDSQAPNKAVEEWLREDGLLPQTTLVRPETQYRHSRFDFYMETADTRNFIEVKGVTLEQEQTALFPDAPSERAVKHIEELIEAKKEGYGAYLIFVIQMKGITHFEPNKTTQPAFAEALIRAREAGVHILSYDCQITEDSMRIDQPVSVKLSVLDEIAEPLLTWYDRGRRILPWREEPTPYHVWVSEIMLQQTRVEAVKPYYDQFMTVLPDIAALAKADEETLLKLWEGLGYYNRVRNLHKAAVQIMEQYQGVMPSAYEDLLQLVGIGSYTAGAVSSIAFGQSVPAVDGNVLRVLARLRLDDRDISLQRVKQSIERELKAAMPLDRPGDFNQALMELGAMTCIPNGAPKCGECPWEGLCEAHRCGLETKYPVKAAKKARTIEEKTILVLRDAQKTALHKRPDKGLLAGMYEFPTMEGHRTEEEVLEFLKEKGLHAIRIQRLAAAKHIFTHKEWHMIGYAIRVDELATAQQEMQDNGYLFVETEEAERKYPIPSAYAAYYGTLFTL